MVSARSTNLGKATTHTSVPTARFPRAEDFDLLRAARGNSGRVSDASPSSGVGVVRPFDLELWVCHETFAVWFSGFRTLSACSLRRQRLRLWRPIERGWLAQ